jgi:transketolase
VGGHPGGVVGIDHFGASAPGGTLLANFGFTEDNVVERALAVLHREHIEKARMLRNLSA